jgi:hypothetical protein
VTISILGRAVARLATRVGGQLMLELPDDLEPSFVAELISGANAEVPADPTFAIFVHEQRRDVQLISPQCDFHELAGYRQGARLAAAYATDNSGMATYSSVFPLLLPGTFPADQEGSAAAGIAGLADFAATLCEVLLDDLEDSHWTRRIDSEAFTRVASNIIAFLAKAYEGEGNGQSSFSTDWWRQVGEWVECLKVVPEGNDPTGIERMYGCAGLPIPSKGEALSMTPQRFVSVLRSRWSTANAIILELGRIRSIPRAQPAADKLAALEWAASNEQSSLRTDSLVAHVSLAAWTDRAIRVAGWSSLHEDDFSNSFIEAKGKLRIRRGGKELPAPWAGTSPVLIAAVDEIVGPAAERVHLLSIELVVPFRPGADATSLTADLAALARGVTVSSPNASSLDWHLVSFDQAPDGVHLNGTLKVTTSKKAPNVVSLEVLSHGDASSALVDRCTGTFTLLRPWEAALWARKNTRAVGGPVVWSTTSAEDCLMGLPEAGKYELAVAWGDQTQIRIDNLQAGTTPVAQPWTDLAENGARELVDIGDAFDVSRDGEPIFRITMASTFRRILSPIVAAAHGVLPDAGRTLPEGTLDYLEGVLGSCLAGLEAGCALGAVLATSTKILQELGQLEPGVYCAPNIAERSSELTPTLPSQDLRADVDYGRLRDAYSALGITSMIEAIEELEKTSGVTMSRISLVKVSRERIDELLAAYASLLARLEMFSLSDRFWARHPFSVAVLGDGIGLQSAQAVLLSPLHPLRLAWNWAVQVGLQGAFDDGVSPSSSLALLDGTHFPAYCLAEDRFGSTMAFMSVPIDPYPDDLYLAWHASVAVISGRPAVPEFVAGRRFPVDGLSAISAASVGSAIDDLLRVSPQIQALKIELAAVAPARRSATIDDGLLSKMQSLAISSTNLDGVAGIQVFDSTDRLGPMPHFDSLEDAFSVARPGFNAQWTSIKPSQVTGSHVSFLEGSAAQATLDRSLGIPRGWLSELPLRRTPSRERHAGFVQLDYGLAAQTGGDTSFGHSLVAYETSSQGSRFVLKLIPNLAGIVGRPNWLVAADFGIDPQSLSQTATMGAGTDYVLWDWRPATATKPNGGRAGRVHPYFVLAALPRALSNAIRARLRLLNGTIDEGEVEKRTKLLVSTLASRAIGLNTLLSIGHHQATGALGFYFSLRSLSWWMLATPDNEVRLVIPVDAVDPFIRASAPNPEGNQQRADLLVVRAWIEPDKEAHVVIVPVEIKHYGLNASETSTQFPLAGDKCLVEHVEQLHLYQQQLASLCEAYRDAVGAAASILGQRLAALLDAAVQLSPKHSPNASKLLSSVASGMARVELGKGVLVWYQAGGTGIEGAKAEWDEVSGTIETQRVEVKVDPAAFDDAMWGAADGACHTVICEALDNASIASGESIHVGAAGTKEDHGGADAPSPAAADAVAAPEGDGTSFEGDASNPSVDMPTHPDASKAEVAKSATSSPEISSMPAARVDAKGGKKTLTQKELDNRYKVLLGALSEFGVKVDRPKDALAYREGPGFVEYAVHPSYGVSVSRVEAQLENLKLRLSLPAEAVIGCSTHLGNIHVTVPKPDAERYFVDAVEMWAGWVQPSTGFVIPLGVDIAGEVVSLDLASSNSPHILIAGVTGSGKSEALLTILHGAAHFNTSDDLQLLLVDPKQTELTSLEGLPHVRGQIGWTSEDAIDTLNSAVEEMERRYTAFRTAGNNVRSIADFRAAHSAMARWIVVLDEYADLVSDDDDRAKIEKAIKRLAQKARAAGIHLILSTQKPVVSVVNTVVKGNLPGRIALRVNSATESRVVLDEGGAEQLVGKGDAIIKIGISKQRVQFARYAIEDV